MSSTNRRDFLRASAAAALSAAVPADLFAQSETAQSSPGTNWDSGSVRHLLPTVSDSRMLVKVSFTAPVEGEPRLRVGDLTGRGGMGDTRVDHWHFYATDLAPGPRYPLSLFGSKGRALCQPWELATFPGPGEWPNRFRLLIYTCGGGHEVHKFLPTAVRNRLLRRGLSFQPDAMVANGDPVYWDLLAPVGSRLLGAAPEAVQAAGTFDRSATVLGSDNETVLKRAAGPQIVPVYGTDFRSTPVFFLQDDHDYFDNDEATDEVVTFPPSYFMLQHDRLIEAMAAVKNRAHLVISGDLHAIAIGRMLRSGRLDLKDNPVNVVLSGPIGSRPGPLGWPSGRRGTGAMPPAHLDMEEQVKPIEQHGFTVADFTPEKIVLRLFKWDIKTQSVDAIDTLQPFHTAELTRPT